MLVALIAQDKSNSLDLRMENRPAHKAYLHAHPDKVHLAGPLHDKEGAMCGSLIVLDVADMAEAEAWAAGDPYAKAGLFADVSLKPWTKVIG
ncbi:MAG: YciI family protein [Pseudomonadota bacterium]